MEQVMPVSAPGTAVLNFQVLGRVCRSSNSRKFICFLKLFPKIHEGEVPNKLMVLTLCHQIFVMGIKRNMTM
jgi:hypothetical protein